MEQSPKANRPHGPSERPPMDNLPYSEQGGQTKPQGPKSGGPKVPDLDFSGGAYQGGSKPHSERTSTSSPAPDRSGTPGYVSAPNPSGCEHQFESDRGGNS